MGNELEDEVRNVNLGTKARQSTVLEVCCNGRIKLTEQEYDCSSMGKFQNIPLFGVAVESADLIITRHHVEPVSRHTP
jgi:hypothetical protein